MTVDVDQLKPDAQVAAGSRPETESEIGERPVVDASAGDRPTAESDQLRPDVEVSRG